MKEAFGYITKLEKLINISANIIPGTLVLEAQEPYPGYHYSYLPNNSLPQSIFLITTNKLDAEAVYRYSELASKLFTEKFQAAPCFIKFFDQELFGIRIKYLADYTLINELQQAFLNVGVKFKKSKKNVGAAYIKVRKNFELEDFIEGCYSCPNLKSKCYIIISKKISFDEFDQITRHIKNNIDFINFDAALGAIYSNYKMIDLIRIVGEYTEENIVQIRDAYRKEINKL